MLEDLNNDIRNKSFRPAYLLYGEEEYLKSLYKKRLRNAIVSEGDIMNFNSYEGKDIDVKKVIDQAQTLPFFAEHRMILIENSGFFKNAVPELADYLPVMPAETIIVFVEKEADRRTKMFKEVKAAGRAEECGRQNEKTLTDWVLGKIKKENKKIEKGAIPLFFEKTGNDMCVIEQELEKLLSYTLDRDRITVSDVKAVCTETIEDRIFEMVGAIAGRQQKKALDLYYDLLSLKEAPMRILFLIARQFNQMLQIKDLKERGMSNAQMASAAGLKPWVARNILSQAEGYSKESLVQAVKDCVEAEESFKTGKIRDQLAVEILIIRLSSDAS